MALKEIMAISGYSGLYKFVSQGRNGIIVESLSDGKRSHIPASAKVSSLSDIAIFTVDGEKSLREVLSAIKEKANGGPTISHKASNDELKAFFATIEPNYDVERVYASDIKKVVAWYNQLQELNLHDFSVEEPKGDEVQNETSDSTIDEKPSATKKGQAKSATGKEKKVASPKKTAISKPKGAGDAGAKRSPHQKKT